VGVYDWKSELTVSSYIFNSELLHYLDCCVLHRGSPLRAVLVVLLLFASRVALQFSALRDDNGQLGLAVGADGNVFDLADGQHAIDDLAKYHMLVVQPVASVASDEKLAAIRVGTRIGHGEQARPGVLEIEILVIKLVAVDRDAACAIPFDEISALTHEALDDPMEGATLVANGLTSLPAVHKRTRGSVG